MLERDILKKAQEGDLKAIEEICSLTWEPLYRFIYYRVQNRQEAEDITQEAYVRALSQIKKGGVRIEAYINYLKKISLNILSDKWRKKNRRGTGVNLEAVNPVETSVPDSAEAVEQRLLLEKALSRLNEEQRMVIELRIIKGYSVAETARIMNKKEGTVRVLQYRALHTLASILGKNHQMKEAQTDGGYPEKNI